MVVTDNSVTDILWQRLMPVMVKKFESSPAWRRIAERLLTAVHVTHLESVLVPLLKLSPRFVARWRNVRSRS
jgi:hypothetical protein